MCLTCTDAKSKGKIEIIVLHPRWCQKHDQQNYVLQQGRHRPKMIDSSTVHNDLKWNGKAGLKRFVRTDI